MATLLRNKEVADRIGISLASFYRLAKKEIPVVKVGPNTIRYNSDDVDAFIKRRTEALPDAR